MKKTHNKTALDMPKGRPIKKLDSGVIVTKKYLDSIIGNLLVEAEEAAKVARIQEYHLITKETDVSTKYRNPAEIADAIDRFMAIKVKYCS